MRRQVVYILLVTFLGVSLLLAGCSSSSKAPDPVVDDLLRSALAAQPPTVPAASAPNSECTAQLVTLLAFPPETQAGLANALQQWTARAAANPNEAACQLGLSLTMLAYAMDRVANALGHDPFDNVDPMGPASVMALAASSGPGGLVAAYENLLISKRGEVSTAGSIPRVDFTSGQLHTAISTHLLPVLYSQPGGVYQRLAAFGDSEVATALISASPAGSDEIYTMYACDFNMMAASIQALRGFLLEVFAYELAPGDWSPAESIIDMDANEDGVVTPDEYMPPRPFGTIRPYGINYMQGAYEAYLDAVDRALDATENIPDDPTDLLARLFAGLDAEFADSASAEYSPPETGLEVLQLVLRHFQALLEGEQVLTLQLWNEGERPVEMDFRVNITRMYTNPVADIRNYMPSFQIVPVESDGLATANSDEPEFYVIPTWEGVDMTFNGVLPDLEALSGAILEYEFMTLVHAGMDWGEVPLDFLQMIVAPDWEAMYIIVVSI